MFRKYKQWEKILRGQNFGENFFTKIKTEDKVD